MDGSKHINLLLIDDEDDFRKATSMALTRRGFEVADEPSGPSALYRIAGGYQPDLVILDLRMAEMDGIATLRELRTLKPRLPVIILTGHGNVSDAAEGIDLEISDFLKKPVDIEELSIKIRALIESGGPPLRERRLEELIIPVSSYRQVRADEPLHVWVAALRDAMFQQVVGHISDRGHRSVLVYEPDGQFVGILRRSDIIRSLIPDYAWSSPSSVAFTGLFLAQSKVLRDVRVRELVDDRPPLDLETPLMEAAHTMALRGVINLPVAKKGELVGVLRDRDLLFEIARAML